MSARPYHSVIIPAEIIDQIIRSLVSTGASDPYSLPPSDICTKPLLTLARTSRVTYPEAIRLLYTHCVCINTPEQLHRITRTLTLMASQTPSHFTDLALPRTLEDGQQGPFEALLKVPTTITNSIVWESTIRNPSLPPVTRHQYILSMSLQPFQYSRGSYGLAENLAISHSIYDLLTLIASTLTRLHISAKLESTHPFGNDDSQCIGIAYREGIKQCTKVNGIYCFSDFSDIFV